MHHRRSLASTLDYQKGHNPKQHFLSLFEDPPTKQPYIKDLVPTAIAVSRITPLALSTLLSLSLKLRKSLIVYSFFSKVIYPSSIFFSRQSTTSYSG